MKAEDIAVHVIDSLSAVGIPYMLVGSFSSNFYGIPRSTKDAVFVIELGTKRIRDLRTQLGDAFSLDPQMAFETITGTTKNLIRVEESDFVVELFRVSKDPHDRERFARRQCHRILGRDVFLPTAEDVIVTKLRWLRAKDREDVAGVIGVQGDTLDWEYIHHWADEHGTRSALEEIRRLLS